MAPRGSGRLDALGLSHGTDKASSRHRYLDIYEEHLAPLADRPVTLLEIGIFNGASLRMWRDFFPLGRIVGLDIKRDKLSLAEERVAIEIGDASDPRVLEGVAARHGPFDIVLDDGSHRWAHQQAAFLALFPHLRPGGHFIIEDLHTSFVPKYGTPEGEPTTAWLRRHLDLLIAEGREPEAPRPDGSAMAAIWQAGVRQATFLRKAVIIQRR